MIDGLYKVHTSLSNSTIFCFLDLKYSKQFENFPKKKTIINYVLINRKIMDIVHECLLKRYDSQEK